MKIIAIIPARYSSSRFPGKPLADICGKPMVWWVYQQVKKVQKINDVYIATDDKRIEEACSGLGLNIEMTAAGVSSSTERAYEVAKRKKADYYVVVNGDEPLIEPETIGQIIPHDRCDGFYVGNLMTQIKRPEQVVDVTNIKVVTDEKDNALFMSRSPIPYPKSSMEYEYYKHVGVLIYSFDALKFFTETSKGHNERIEDINELRFLEHNKKIKMTKVETAALSVDVPKDLEYVKEVLSRRKIGGGYKGKRKVISFSKRKEQGECA